MLDVRQHLDDRRYPLPAWIDQAEQVATFPLWNLSGQLVGYQQYRPFAPKCMKNDPREGRYFTRLKDRRIGVWGLEFWNLSNTLFVVEGIFDACAVIDCGFSCVAVLSCDTDRNTQRWFWTVRRMRPVVVIADGDDAGKKLLKLGHKGTIMSPGRDLGDMSRKEVMAVLKGFL